MAFIKIKQLIKILETLPEEHNICVIDTNEKWKQVIGVEINEHAILFKYE